MHDELYPEIDEFANHDIDEEGIAKSLLPYIKSLHQSIQKYIRHLIILYNANLLFNMKIEDHIGLNGTCSRWNRQK